MKLLIADDNPSMRSILRGICGEHFSEINECEDGLEAIRIYEKQKPDLVLMDFKMKTMDGIKATKEIKNRFPEAKIIIISQYNDKSLIEESIKSGAIEFINKVNLIMVEEIIKTRL